MQLWERRNEESKKHKKNQMSSPMVSYNVYTCGFKIDTVHPQM